jgi:hypothetical protein
MKLLEWLFGTRPRPAPEAAPGDREVSARLIVSETEDDIAEGDEFITKVVGDSHLNDDGTSRQKIIAQCRAGERLVLRPEPTNRFDSNAVGVYRATGQQIGHLSRRRAAEVHSYLTHGRREMSAIITAITGGTAAKPYRGVNIEARLLDE